MAAKKGQETKAKNKKERARKFEYEAARKLGQGSSKDPQGDQNGWDQDAETTGSGQVGQRDYNNISHANVMLAKDRRGKGTGFSPVWG